MRIWIGLLAVLLMAGGAWAQGAGSEDVPLDDPAYQDVRKLHGIVEYPAPIYGRPYIMTRYEFAIDTLRALRVIQAENSNWLMVNAGANKSTTRQLVARLQKEPEAQYALSRLLKNFSPDINAILNSNPGVRISGLESGQIEFATRELAAGRVERIFSDVAPPFSDVSPSHWAFEAVEYLRFSGIVDGYPKGNFNAR